MQFTFDADKLATDVVMKRQVKSRITTRQAAKQAGITNGTISRVETRKGLSIESFLKVCSWLEVCPGEYFKQVEK